MKTITVDVYDTGEVKLTTAGFAGKSCIKESKFLKDLLGKETTRQLVAAYYTEGKQVVKRHIPLCG